MKIKTKKKIRMLCKILFFAYLLVLVYFLFFAEWYGRGVTRHADFQYNLKPFREIMRFWKYREQLGFRAVFLNIFGNILGFVPFGFILPMMSRKLDHFPVVVLLGLGFSLLVECMQLILRVGSFDVDDLLLNTLGAAFGYLIFLICNRIRRHHGKRT